MRTSKKVYQHRLQCQYKGCGVVFYCSHSNRRYCSFACSELAQGERKQDKMATDPTPEEIADMCRKIRSGELVIQSSQERAGAARVRIKPNWFMENRIR